MWIGERPLRAVQGRRGVPLALEPTRAHRHIHRAYICVLACTHARPHHGHLRLLPSFLAPAFLSSQVRDYREVDFFRVSCLATGSKQCFCLSCARRHLQTQTPSNQDAPTLHTSDQAGGVYRARCGHHLGPGAQPLGRGLWLLHHLRGRQDTSQPLQPLPPAPGLWVCRAPQGTSLGEGGARVWGQKLWGWARVVLPQGPDAQHQVASPFPGPHAHLQASWPGVSPCLSPSSSPLPTAPPCLAALCPSLSLPLWPTPPQDSRLLSLPSFQNSWLPGPAGQPR